MGDEPSRILGEGLLQNNLNELFTDPDVGS